ncbi:organomercurial lyase MerB [Micromonospora globbae]|uniref:organomercurial lyase MerB n=1 Tax=Micromonospora globbae TaxID=1894969 RepID=UPI0037B2DEA0
MSTDIEHLATRIGDSLGPRSVNMPPGLWRPLLKLLALGEPVTVEDLAQATRRTLDEVRDALAGLPDTEYDEQGRIIGHGITLRPTPHQFDVDGRALFTWCALDTLIFPAVLGRPARVQSPCHGTGVPVHLTVEPDQVTSVDPATAVVSIVTPETCASIRAAFCNQVHFFASPAAAQPWLDQHPEATVLPASEAFALGGPLTQTLLTAEGEPGCR